MNWNAIPGIACTVAFLLPVLVIIYNKFYTHRSLGALMLYYFLMALVTAVCQGLLVEDRQVKENFGVVASYLNIPLMLTSLMFFCPIKIKQRTIHILTVIFICYEIVITMIHGFTHAAGVCIIGLGLIVVLGYAFFLFVRQVKFSIMHGKNQGRILMLAAVLFAYSCYLLLYCFSYILKTPYESDTILLYYLSSSISAIIMTVGLQLMRKRLKDLQSLKLTRKELAIFFGE